MAGAPIMTETDGPGENPVASAARGLVMAACHRSPLLSGNSSVGESRLFRAITPRGSTAISRLRNGLRLVVFPNDYIGRNVLWFGDYDRKITLICTRVLRPGDAMLDIGAHHGLVSMFASAAVGAGGIVHAFEPQPRLAATLRRSVELNGLSNVRLHEVALSDRDGRMSMHVPANNTSAAALGGCNGGAGSRIEVIVREAGGYLAGLGLPKVRLIKLDVEDHEEQVLRSAAPFLRENRPSVVLFESHHRGVPFWERGPVKILRSLGYDFFQVPKALLRLRLERVPEGREPAGPGYDFAAIADHADRPAILRTLRAD